MNTASTTPVAGEVALHGPAAGASAAAAPGWPGVTAKRWLLVTSAALIGLVPYSASELWPPEFDRFRPLGAATLLVTTWIALLGVAAVERTDHGTSLQPWRYLPVGIAASIAGPLLTVLLFWAATELVLGLDAGDYSLARAFHGGGLLGAIFENLVIVNGVLFVYLLTRNAGRLARLAADAEARGAEARRRLAASELAASQALVDPGFLLGTLDRIEQLYDRSAAAGEGLMDALTRYLRAALSLLDDERSTLGDQLALAGAYLRIEQSRLGGELVCKFDIAPGLRKLRLPPVLVPLVRWMIERRIGLSPGGGRLQISAGLTDGRLTLELAGDLTDPAIDLPGDDDLAALRSLVTALFGDRSRLVSSRNDSGGMTLRLEAPHAE